MLEPLDNENDEHNEEDHLDDIRMENEIKKIKLSLEHGMDLSNQFTDPDLPPEVEGQFLDYIQQFEEQFAQKKTILVYELAGKPEWKPVAELSDIDVPTELERIINILNEHSISIETICPVEERELYRFITEELFNEETNDIRIEGMTHGFIYEEFHPNHEYDIKNRCKEFIEHILDKDKESSADCWAIGDEMELQGITYSKEAFKEKLAHFSDSFSSFTIHEFDADSIDIDRAAENAVATYHIHYSGNIEGSPETVDLEGLCTFSLKCEHGWWVVHKFDVPGVVI